MAGLCKSKNGRASIVASTGKAWKDAFMDAQILRYLPWVLVLAGICSWGLAFFTRRWAFRAKALDFPTEERKIHDAPMPLLGGLGIGITIVAIIAIAIGVTGLHGAWLGSNNIETTQVMGFLLGVIILMIGGAVDDRFELKPSVQILFPSLAAVVIMASGTHILHITNWISGGEFSLVWRVSSAGPFAFLWPADPLTLLWILTVTYATKFLDGLDGLVSGQTVIGSGLIAGLALTMAFFQPEVALLAMIVGGAFFGFLPHNMTPAKQFLGESGSTIAGFSLAFLAMLGGAKMATAFIAVGIPLVDAGVVVAGRLLRGASPFKGDKTHLHFRLLDLGLKQKQAVYLMWCLSLAFGLIAFGLQSAGKIVLILAIVIVAISLSIYTGKKLRKKNIHG